MDDHKNGEYSRAPEFEDLLAICKALNKEAVEYILIGGFAVILHGFARGTKDIDFLVDTALENIQKIKKALSTLPDKAILLIQDDDVEKYTVVRVADEVVVDLMAKACGINYQKASNQIDHVTIEGITIPVAKKELLIRMKDTVRPSDKMDVAFLKARLEKDKK